MYYAGPREAIHHAIKATTWFTHFVVKSAGIEGCYAPQATGTRLRNTLMLLALKSLYIMVRPTALTALKLSLQTDAGMLWLHWLKFQARHSGKN